MSIGSYKGVAINPGTDAQVAAQVAAIDKQAVAAAAPVIAPVPTSPTGGGAAAPTGASGSATPAQAYKGFNYAPNATDTAIIAAGKQAAAAASATPDENKIYNQKLQMYQAQIDATNKIYADQLGKQQVVDQNNLGTGRAVQARSGVLGSDFGVAQTSKIQTGNDASDQAIRDANAAAVASILGLARSDAAAEYTAKATAQQKGLTDYLTYLGNQETRNSANLTKVASAILDQGLDINDIDPAKLAEIAKSYGVSTGDITAAYAAQKKQNDLDNLTVSKDNSFNLSPGESHYTYDPKTGQLVQTASVAAAPKTIGTPATGIYTENADGSYTQTMAPVGGENVQSLAQELVTGNLAPADLSKRSAGVGSYNDILKAANDISNQLYGKPFDIAKASTDYNYANNKNTQDTLNYLGSLVGSADGSTPSNLDEVLSLSKKVAKPGFLGIGETSFPAINNAEQWAKLSSGNPDVAAYYATITEVSDQIAKILQGGSSGGTSDAKLAQAQSLFQKGFTPDQIEAVVGSLKPLLMNRGISMVKDNPYLSSYALQFGITQNNAKATNQAATTANAGEGFGWDGN